MFCHAGQGQLHIQPFLNLAVPEDVQKMQRLAEDLYEEVFDVGGTISGEHACGLSRTPFVRRQCGPLYDVFREIKRIFDPKNILNPGKIVADEPDPLTREPAAGGRRFPRSPRRRRGRTTARPCATWSSCSSIGTRPR